MEKSSKIDADTKLVERAFQAHLADFNSCRQEILLQISMQNQMINYAIAIAAAIITLSAIVQGSVVQKSPFILLVGSLLTSAINWSLVEASIAIANLVSYINDNLAPKIRKLINQNKKFEFDVLRWEEFAISQKKHGPWVIFGLGKHAIAYIPNIFFLVFFYITKIQNAQAWTTVEIILYCLAIVMALAVPIGGLIRLKIRI